MANMREVMRSIAHGNMERLGYVHVNKKKNEGNLKEPNYFARNWRKYTQYIPEKKRNEA